MCKYATLFLIAILSLAHPNPAAAQDATIITDSAIGCKNPQIMIMLSQQANNGDILNFSLLFNAEQSSGDCVSFHHGEHVTVLLDLGSAAAIRRNKDGVIYYTVSAFFSHPGVPTQ